MHFELFLCSFVKTVVPTAERLMYQTMKMLPTKEIKSQLIGISDKIISNLEIIHSKEYKCKPVIIFCTEDYDIGSTLFNIISGGARSNPQLHRTEIEFRTFDASTIDYHTEYLDLITSLPEQGGVLFIENANMVTSEFGLEYLRLLLSNNECRLSSDGKKLLLNKWCIVVTARTVRPSSGTGVNNSIIKNVGGTVYFIS